MTINNREVFIATLESKLVGTSTVSIVDCNKWFHKGSAAYIELAGVDANYKGHHIFQSILDEQFRYIDGKGVDLIFTVSAEQNAAVKNTFMKKGFKKVAYGAGKSNNFYSVYYARWEKKCPYSDAYIALRYFIDKVAHVIYFKKGGERRI